MSYFLCPQIKFQLSVWFEQNLFKCYGLEERMWCETGYKKKTFTSHTRFWVTNEQCLATHCSVYQTFPGRRDYSNVTVRLRVP